MRARAKGEIFNLGSGVRNNLKYLIQVLEDELGSFDVFYDSEKKGDVKNTLADISKAKRILNYIPITDLKKGVKLFIDGYKLHMLMK